MNIKNISDDELIEEVFNRMYKDDSKIIGAKIWTTNDIISYDKELTKEDANEIVNFVDKDVLTDCTDEEWLVIEEAIKEWGKARRIINDFRRV